MAYCGVGGLIHDGGTCQVRMTGERRSAPGGVLGWGIGGLQGGATEDPGDGWGRILEAPWRGLERELIRSLM